MDKNTKYALILKSDFSNFEKAFVVILIAIKIMTLIVLNQDILFP